MDNKVTVADGQFYYCGGHGFDSVPVNQTRELRYWPYSANDFHVYV